MSLCSPRPDLPSSPARAEWRAVVAPYQHPSVRRSVTQLAVTLLALAGSFVAMHYALRVGYWLTLALSLVAAGFLVRTFIIMHDCGHGSFFRSRRANDLVGFVTGALTLTPYAQWAKDHAIHHATSGRLDKRGYGDIETLTVEEYRALGRLGRIKYAIYRNPVVLLVLGPIWLVAKQRVHTKGSGGRREILGVHLTNATILVALTAACLLVGPGAVAAIYAPTVFFAAAGGIFLFYVQHQYERTYWASGKDWDYATAALAGSSFYRLPRVLDWMTGSIGFHHVHHLSPRIPNYYLRRGPRGEPVLPPGVPPDAAGERGRVLAQAVGRGAGTHGRLGRRWGESGPRRPFRLGADDLDLDLALRRRAGDPGADRRLAALGGVAGRELRRGEPARVARGRSR